MTGRRFVFIGLGMCLAAAYACSGKASSPTSPSTAAAAKGLPAASDGSTLKVTAPTPTSPIGDQALTDSSPTLTASGSTGKYGSVGGLQYRFELYNESNAKVADSGLLAGPSYKVTTTLDFKKRYTWRLRAEAQGGTGPWSSFGSFVSPEGGYIRGNEVFDPIYNGTTVGQVQGPVTFIPNKGARLETVGSYIRYTIPVTITSGEFSMEIEGLRANAPGDKSKVFGMMSGTADYITDPYRVDVQYRGTGGSPPNSITYRVLYGDANDLNVRYEPTTDQRISSVRNLDPNTTYFWKYTWGKTVRVTVQQGGPTGPTIYDITRNSTNGSYNPVPHTVFIGTPTGRSGAESASIPGTIYRNVWIGARPRPF